MTRTLLRTGVLVGVLMGVSAPAWAQVVHSVSFGVGVFTPRGFDSRVADDVWVANLTQPVIPGTNPPITGSLDFNISKFRANPIYGEWHIGFGNHIEVGVGAAYQNRRVPSVYADLVNGHGTLPTNDDTEIQQDLRLRVIPITGVVRVLAGKVGGFQPYMGVGIAALNFRYSEVGDFVDTSDFTVFSDRFVATGTAVGPVLLGGLRMPIGGDVYAFNLEGRYQWATGKTGGSAAGFLGDKIDLSGGSVNFGFLIRF